MRLDWIAEGQIARTDGEGIGDYHRVMVTREGVRGRLRRLVPGHGPSSEPTLWSQFYEGRHETVIQRYRGTEPEALSNDDLHVVLASTAILREYVGAW